MFRQTKRKPKVTATRRSRIDDQDDDGDAIHGKDQPTLLVPSDTLTRSKEGNQEKKEDEEEEEESPFILRKHQEKKQKKKKIKRQGDDDNGDDGDETQVNRKSYKRRRGLAVAATTTSSTTRTRMTMIIDDDDDDENDFDPLQQPGDDIAPTYNKEALQALKAEQKRLQHVRNQEAPSMEANADAPQPEAPILYPNENATESSMNQDFISFHDMEETTEHDVFPRDDDNVMSQHLDHEHHDEDDEVDDQWEQQIAKRAGIPQSTDTKAPTRPAVVTPSLAMLRETLQGTIQHLATSEENLSHAIMRREADLAQTLADEKRQQESIHEAGKACSDYQELRYQLAMWVGALRDLEEKVLPIQKSLLDMVLLQWEMAHQEWRYWQDDVCVTLQEVGRLDRVLGWIPPNVLTPEGDAQQQLDEFGRDIGSQVRRDRDNRFRRRKQKEVSIGTVDRLDDSILDYLWSHEEGASHRYEILQEALRVAMDDLDEDYTSPQRLVTCFETWQQKYPDEYRQCYANLSLADLAHVFDQVDLCLAPWVRACLKEHQDLVLDGTLFPTTISMPVGDDDSHGDDPENSSKPSWEKVYRKEYIPFLLEVSKESPSIIFLSKRMSKFFCQSLQDIFHKVGHDSKSTQELCNAFASAGVTVLQSLSIPLATPTKVGELEPFEDRLQDALRFTQTWQPQWIQNLLLHLLEDWIPLVETTTTTTSNESREPLTQATLSFLSETYLYFLSSLSNSQTAMEHFAPIWNCLCRKYRHLLESPDRILQSAPLRAAASAYGLQTRM